jgi:CMP-N,N'-diacetyllegionaminic acid synthase
MPILLYDLEGEKVMYKGYNIIALIPARGGSVGIKRKNIKEFVGKPLIVWSIEAARKSKYVDSVYVSTEDKQIADTSLFFGAKVLNRPNELAQNDSHIKDVMKYHINELKLKDNNLIVLLNPTSPIRIIKDFNTIDYCLEQFNPDLYDQAASGYMCRNYEWGKASSANRQVLTPWAYDDANVYIHKSFYLINNEYFCPDINRRLFIKIPEIFNKEIDSIEDFIMLEALMKYVLRNGDNINVPI